MSNEAPKKIWLDSDGAAWEHYSEEDTQYIRADLVDGLVEALKKGMEFNEAYWKLINFSPSDTGLIKELTDKARAALKALEEE
jgi:hypothetical protein